MPRRRPYIFLPQVKLCPFVAYPQVKLRVDQVWSTHIQGPCMSCSQSSRPDSIRLTHRAQHATQSHTAQVSNPMTMYVLSSQSQSLVSTPWGPLSTSSVSTSRHVVPRTQPKCSPANRGILPPPS